MLSINIKTGGAAYRDEDGDMLDPCATELQNNLYEIAKMLSVGCTDGRIMDSNGNNVGSWSLD